MTITYSSLSLVVLLVSALAAPNAVVRESKPFWRPAGGSAQIEVEGDISRLRGTGWVRTTRAYLDVRVELDFRVADEKSDGTLVLRGVVGRPGEKPSSGYRVRLTASKTQQTGETKAIAHRLTRETYHAPAGSNDWQHLEVSVSRDQVVTTVNGRVVSTVEGREHQAGYIGLEVVRGIMEFRHIRVTPIGATSCLSRNDTPASASVARTEGASSEVAVGPGPGIELPKVVRQQKPQYTTEAMADKVQGVLWVDAVVLKDGSVGDVCVTKSLHDDLDVEALAAARQWHFKPGTRGGKPVAVLVMIELTFTLKAVLPGGNGGSRQ